jgi:phosphate starvation-inducible PhoH-like protein
MFEKLKEVDRIEMRPVAYMRGSTFNNAFMILDEAQNMNFHQLMTYITRLGENSKMVICGDVSQHDIRHNLVALPEFQRMIQDVNNIGTFTFEKKDIVRNKIIIDIVEKYEEWKEKNMQTNEGGKGKGNGHKGS